MAPPTQALAAVSDCRVLTVDDNPANTRLVQQLLTRAGLARVATLQDSTQIVETLTIEDPDLVLVDLRMPGFDGFQVLDLIQRWAGGTYLPVIIVTADNTRDAVERALGLGAHDFITKPFDATELVLRVRNLLINRNAYKELRRSRAWLRSRLDVFEPDLATSGKTAAEIRAIVTETITNDDFQIALQPIVDMRDGSVKGAEALARFPTDILGSTAGWFAAALEADFVVELELATAQKAITLLANQPPGTHLGLNFSPATVVKMQGELLGQDVDPARVVIELTEHTPVEDYRSLLSALEPLRTRGAQLAVDDTGAGFASLRHIIDLRPDIIKIDMGIIRGVDIDPTRAAIARMLVGFADTMAMCVVAEGVETEQERTTLIGLGAKLGQGYLFGRPEIATFHD